MVKFWRLFLKVFRTYTIEEKVVSIVILGVLFFLIIQGFVVYLRGQNTVFDKGLYTEAIVSDKPVLVNPLFTDFNQANRDISSLVFSGLTKYDPRTKSFTNDLAVLRISEDKMSYFFTLRDNIFWHDGQPINADDVLFTFKDIIQSPDFQNPILKANFDKVHIEKIDDKNIKFTLNSPNAFFITNLNVGILPKHILYTVKVADLPNDEFNFKPIGSGPYKVDGGVESFEDGRQKIKLFLNDQYYGQKPKITEIRFNLYPDEEILLKDKDSINVISKVTPTLLDALKDKRFTFIPYELPQYIALFFNTNTGLLKEKKLRIGLLKSLDKEELLKLLTNKTRVDTPLMELNQGDWIYKPNSAEANGSFFDAGYNFPKDAKGQRVPTELYRKDKNGKILELTLIARKYDDGSSMANEIKLTADLLINSWLKNGVKVNFSLLEENDFLDTLASRGYDMVLTGQSMGYNLDTYPYWHSSQANSHGLNLSNYKSFAADQIIEKIRSTFDQEEKNVRLTQLAKIIAADVPAIFLYRPTYIFASDLKLKGVNLNNLSYPSDRFAYLASWCVQCNQ